MYDCKIGVIRVGFDTLFYDDEFIVLDAFICEFHVKLSLLGNTHLGFKNYLQLDGLYISTTLGLCGFLH